MPEDLAKELFGMSVKTALSRRCCVSCKESTTIKTFDTVDAYESYKKDGLCQACQKELE